MKSNTQRRERGYFTIQYILKGITYWITFFDGFPVPDFNDHDMNEGIY